MVTTAGKGTGLAPARRLAAAGHEVAGCHRSAPAEFPGDRRWGDGRDDWLEEVPMRRLGHDDEAAAATEFLTSAAASYVTGHLLSADGSLSAARVLEA
jgi:NAD(P)-dependent dehydrogenase (short-subunit alcohol dehydrogenase family)